jgi:hypothetical protein
VVCDKGVTKQTEPCGCDACTCGELRNEWSTGNTQQSPIRHRMQMPSGAATCATQREKQKNEQEPPGQKTRQTEREVRDRYIGQESDRSQTHANFASHGMHGIMASRTADRICKSGLTLNRAVISRVGRSFRASQQLLHHTTSCKRSNTACADPPGRLVGGCLLSSCC